MQNARTRGVKLEVIEWPGESPKEIQIEMSQATYNKLLQGQRSIIISNSKEIAAYTGLAYGSIVKLFTDSNFAIVTVSPAKIQGKKWVLPILWVSESQNISKLKKEVNEWREENNYAPL